MRHLFYKILNPFGLGLKHINSFLQYLPGVDANILKVNIVKCGIDVGNILLNDLGP